MNSKQFCSFYNFNSLLLGYYYSLGLWLGLKGMVWYLSGVLQAFSIKNIFCDKMYLWCFYFRGLSADRPLISNLAVTTRITINYSRENFFLKWSLNWNSVLSLHLDLKIIFSLQYGKSLVHLSLVLKSNESLLRYGKTKVNFFLGTWN